MIINPNSNQPSGKLLKKLIPLFIILGALAALLVVYLLPSEKVEPKSTPPRPANVVAKRIELIASMPDEFEINGKVEPNRTVGVAAEVDGRIERYGLYTGTDDKRRGKQLDEGDYIRAGEPLIYLNTDLLQAGYNQIIVQHEQNLRDYNRFESAWKRGIATQKELDEARTSLALSKAGLEEVKAKLDRTTILAPVSGVINRLTSEVGEYVQPGMTCAEIVDNDTVKIIVNVSEQDVSYFAVGQQQKILADSQGETITITAPISYISEVAEPLAHTTRMEITIPNTLQKFHPGKVVRVRLKRRDLKNVIMVPLDAIIPLENGYLSYVLEADKAQTRQVRIDIRFIKGKRIRVLSGLEAGDLLILFPGNRLCGPGQEVRIIPEESNQPADMPQTQDEQQEN